jgi:hypothetical protein
MAGTRAALIGRYEEKIIDKAQLQRMLSKGIKPYQSQLPPLLKAFLDLKAHPLYDMFKEAERIHLESYKQIELWTKVPASLIKRAGHQILDCMWVYTYKLDKHH